MLGVWKDGSFKLQKNRVCFCSVCILTYTYIDIRTCLYAQIIFIYINVYVHICIHIYCWNGLNCSKTINSKRCIIYPNLLHRSVCFEWFKVYEPKVCEFSYRIIGAYNSQTSERKPSFCNSPSSLKHAYFVVGVPLEWLSR